MTRMFPLEIWFNIIKYAPPEALNSIYYASATLRDAVLQHVYENPLSPVDVIVADNPRIYRLSGVHRCDGTGKMKYCVDIAFAHRSWSVLVCIVTDTSSHIRNYALRKLVTENHMKVASYISMRCGVTSEDCIRCLIDVYEGTSYERRSIIYNAVIKLIIKDRKDDIEQMLELIHVDHLPTLCEILMELRYDRMYCHRDFARPGRNLEFIKAIVNLS